MEGERDKWGLHELRRQTSAEAQSLGVRHSGARPPACPGSDQSNKYHTQAQNREGVSESSSSLGTGKKEEREKKGGGKGDRGGGKEGGEKG